MPISCHFRDCKVLLVTSLTHVSGAITSVQTFTFTFIIRYDTIRYDSVYLTCSKKLTGSQLSLPHGINKNFYCETNNIV